MFFVQHSKKQRQNHLNQEKKIYIYILSRQETPNSVCVRSISRKSRDLDALKSREVMG